jgi:hypothetical protein
MTILSHSIFISFDSFASPALGGLAKETIDLKMLYGMKKIKYYNFQIFDTRT